MKKLIKKIFIYLDKVLSLFGWRLVKADALPRPLLSAPGMIYRENPEMGPINLFEKNKREKEGDWFEWPNMEALNQALTSFIKDARLIVNIGAGTATFEWFASVDERLRFVAQESDPECRRWSRQNRSKENIIYTASAPKELLAEYGKFDLALMVDVIEHIEDYGSLLGDFVCLADRAVITTPNRDRDTVSSLSLSPAYPQHVREFNSGEFYWLLRAFYRKVDLYTMPNDHLPALSKIGILSSSTHLIAYCRNN